MRIVADSYIQGVKAYFHNLADVVLIPGRDIHPADVREADVLLVRSITRVNASLLLNSSVKFVGSVTAGVDHVDVAWLKKQGITFSAADGFNAPPVADYVVSVVAAMQQKKLLLGSRKKAAVIGVGRVGSLVAAHLNLLGFEVICCDPPRAAADPQFISTPLSAIKNMDLVTVHVPLTHDGEHPTVRLLDRDFFRAQNTGCVFINASRGPVVETDVLLEASQTTHLCLDVYEHEPLISPQLLSVCAIATPHIAGYSVQSKLRGTDMIYRAMVSAGLVPDQPMPIAMPTQTLEGADASCGWRDLVLQVFNPITMTHLLHEKLLYADQPGEVFDHLRHQFAHRQEFAYTQVSHIHLPAPDAEIIQKLGFHLV